MGAGGVRLGPYELGPGGDHEGIYTGDAMELALEMPDESVTWAYADPPYWVNYDYGNKTDEEMKYVEPEVLVDMLLRVARCACLSSGMKAFYRYPECNWQIGWFKPGSTRRSACLNGFNTWEPILVYGKPAKRVWQDSVYLPDAANHTNDGAFHRCPKPLRLMTWLIAGFTAPGDIVFDPMCGSGTTAKAAKQLGRHYLAFEIDPATAELARERVRNTQPPLFVADAQPEQLAMEVT